MPNEKVLLEKQQCVSDLKEKLGNAVAGVLVDYKGISVEKDTKLRKELREARVEYTVVKNTMLRRALKDSGYEEISSVLEQNTALAISNEDPVIAAKILCKYAEDSKGAFGIKAGFADGKALDQASVVALSKLPNREGLLSMLLSALTGNMRGLAVALKAISEKNEAPEEPTTAAE